MILSLKAIDILNSLFVSLKAHKPDSLDPDSFDFVSLCKTYARFHLSSVFLDQSKPFELSYKKFKFLIAKVSKSSFF